MLTGPQITEIMYMFCCCLFLDSFLCLLFWCVFQSQPQYGWCWKRERKKRVCFSPNCELSHFLSMIPYRINSGVLQDQCVHCQTHIYASQVRILHTVLSFGDIDTEFFSYPQRKQRSSCVLNNERPGNRIQRATRIYERIFENSIKSRRISL